MGNPEPASDELCPCGQAAPHSMESGTELGVNPTLDCPGPFREDEHFPWHYTEFGVVCACGLPMDRNETCAAMREGAKADV